MPTVLRRLQSARSGVTVVTPRLLVNGLASHGNVTVPFAAEGVDPAKEKRISRVLHVDGEPLDAAAPKDVILGRGLAQALKVGLGDKVAFVTRVARGGLSGAEGTVRGIFSTRVKAYDDIAAGCRSAMAQTLARRRGSPVDRRFDDTGRTTDAARRIEALIVANRHGNANLAAICPTSIERRSP